MNDNEEMAIIAEEAIMHRDLFISTEVLAEGVYVLEGVYGLDREQIVSVFSTLLQFENIFTTDKKVTLEALRLYGEKKLDFVDCLLCAYAEKDEVLTFDKKLLKCIARVG